MTVRDLAKLAGVSPATISAVINDRPSVSDKKRAEILSLMEEYNYVAPKRKSNVKKNLMFLKLVKSGILIEQNAGFISKIMDSIQIACNKEDYNFLIRTENPNNVDAINKLDFKNVSGVFVIASELCCYDYKILNQITVPYIVIDNSMPCIRCNSITMDNKAMVIQAIEHISKCGEKKFGYFKSSIQTQNFKERNEGVETAVKEFCLDYDKSREFSLEPTILGSYTDLKKKLKGGIDLPKIAFADNDVIALGVIKALLEEGYNIPEDISLIGFDDIYMSESSTPSLSTMHVQRTMIGTMATMMLINEINLNNPTYYKTIVGGELIVRESTKN